MEKKERNLLIWIFSIAGFVLLLLYSPVGSPDAYSSKQLFAANQGVNFFGKIANAPKSIKKFQDSKNEFSSLTKDVEQADYKLDTEINSDNEYKIADPTTKEPSLPAYKNKERKANYAVASNSGSNKLSNEAGYTVNQSKSAPTEKSSGSGGAVGGNGMASYSSSRNSNNNNNPVPQTGFTAMSLDMSMFSDSTSTRQSVDYATGQGGTDPGGNPLEEPIPVGDGWWLLAFMAAIYAAYTRFRK